MKNLGIMWVFITKTKDNLKYACFQIFSALNANSHAFKERREGKIDLKNKPG